MDDVDGAPTAAAGAGRPFPRHRRLAAGAVVVALACGVVGWEQYRAVGSTVVAGDDSRTPGGVGCMPWAGPFMVLDAPVLANQTGRTVHVSSVVPAATPGIRVHEIRIVPPSPDIVFATAYDPADPGWDDTSVVGPEGLTLEPGEVVNLAYVLEVDRTGGSYPYSTVTYDVGTFSYRATYPGANLVLSTSVAECTDSAMNRLLAARIP